MTKVLG